MQSYNEAFQKEYFSLKNPRVKNVRSISVRHEGLNSKVERLHGTIREREKVMRDADKRDGAKNHRGNEDKLQFLESRFEYKEDTSRTSRNEFGFRRKQNPESD